MKALSSIAKGSISVHSERASSASSTAVVAATTQEQQTEQQITEWVNCHGNTVLRLAFSLLGDRGQAEDVFQETFYRAYKSAHRLTDPAKVRPWLLRVAANLCRDLQRSPWWRRFRLGFTARNDLAAKSQHGAGEYALDPAELALSKDTRSAVVKAVWTLPPDMRAVITLYYFEDLSCLEVARVLRIREGTVHSRLSTPAGNSPKASACFSPKSPV